MTAKKKLTTDSYLNFIFFLILPLLLFPPFFRGLFFDYEADIAHIYTAVVLAAYVFIRRGHIRLSKNLMDYSWVGLVIMYIIANFVALNQRSALEVALRVFNFFLIYWLLAQTVQTIKDIRIALTVLFTAGVGVALAGLGTAFGTFSFNGAFNDNLILSTLQYHNAAAIFLVAAGILGFYLAAAYDSLWQRIATGGLNYVILATAFGAGSRGAMLVAPIAFALLIAGMPKSYRLKIFLNFLTVLVPFVITAKQILDFGLHDAGYYWGWLLIGIIIGCGCQYVVERFLTVSAEMQKRVITGIGVGITIIAVGLIVFMGPQVMPASVSARLSNIDLKEVNVQERFYFYRDALDLVKDYPVLGVGGGGWNSAYTNYQTFLYYTTEVHSHPLQVWVETGTIGFLFYVMLWIGLAITVFKIMKNIESVEYRSVAWTCAVGAVAISLHSAIDFSLSLGAVAIFMWALVGLVRAVERICFNEDAANTKPVAGPIARKVVGLTLAGLLFVVSVSLTIAATGEKAAIALYNGGDVTGAMSKFEKTRTFDPLNANYPMYLSQLYGNAAFQSKDPAYAAKAVESAEEAVKLNRMAAQPIWNVAQAYLMAGRPADAVAKAEEGMLGAPWKQDSYDNMARLYVAAAQQYQQMGRKEDARAVLNKVLNMPELIDSQVAKLGPNERRVWTHGPILSVDENIKKSMADANNLLKSL